MEFRTAKGCFTLDKALLFDGQTSALCSDIGHGRKILGIDGSPSHAFVVFLHFEGAGFEGGIAFLVSLLDVSQALQRTGRSVGGAKVFAPQGEGDVATVGQPVAAVAQEGIDGVGRGYRRIPLGCLLLLQQPALHLLNDRRVTVEAQQGFHGGHVGGDGHHAPAIIAVVEGEVGTHRLLLHEVLLE